MANRNYFTLVNWYNSYEFIQSHVVRFCPIDD